MLWITKGFMNKIEGMNDYLCPRAQPEGINNVHALNFIHTSLMIDHPSYTIILQILTLNLPKIHEEATIFTASSPVSCSTKFTVKSMTRLECTIQNRGVRYACAYALAHNNEYLWCISNFWKQNFLKHHFIFTIKYAEHKMVHFKKVRLLFIKKRSCLFLKMWPNIDYQPVLNEYLSPAVNQSQTRKSHNDVWKKEHLLYKLYMQVIYSAELRLYFFFNVWGLFVFFFCLLVSHNLISLHFILL